MVACPMWPKAAQWRAEWRIAKELYQRGFGQEDMPGERSTLKIQKISETAEAAQLGCSFWVGEVGER